MKLKKSISFFAGTALCMLWASPFAEAQMYGGNSGGGYGNQQYGGNRGNQQFGNQQYGGNRGNQQFGNQQYGNRGNQQFGNQQNGNRGNQQFGQGGMMGNQPGQGGQNGQGQGGQNGQGQGGQNGQGQGGQTGPGGQGGGGLMFNNTYAKGVPGGTATHPSVANIAAPNRRVGAPFAGTYVRLSLRNPSWGGGGQAGGGQAGGGQAGGTTPTPTPRPGTPTPAVQPGGGVVAIATPRVVPRYVNVDGLMGFKGRYTEIRREMRLPWNFQN